MKNNKIYSKDDAIGIRVYEGQKAFQIYCAIDFAQKGDFDTAYSSLNDALINVEMGEEEYPGVFDITASMKLIEMAKESISKLEGKLGDQK